jgi:PTH1 family peptidyl-tRNA hydrolase
MGLLRRSGGGTLDALIVGLGNPGRQYAKTRHNIGFMVVDRIAERTGASWRGKYDGRFAETRLGDARVALLEPETFMNLSGRSVSAATRFYKLEPQDVIVVYDDIELEFDKVRARAGGGLKGHNGLRSMAESLGSPDFLRVRCGVGRPRRGDPRSVADYVLGAFYEDEDPSDLIERAADCVETILADGIDEAERRFAS